MIVGSSRGAAQADGNRDRHILRTPIRSIVAHCVARLAADDHGAEFAIALRSDLKGHGLGWLLMHRVLDLAARRGLAEVHGVVLRENTRMLKMCREMGFAIKAHPSDPATMVVRRVMTPRTDPSLSPPAGKGMG